MDTEQPIDLEPTRIRLAYLEAVLLGIERRTEVIDAVYAATTREQVIPTLQALLGLDEAQAIAVSDLQLFRLNAEDRIGIEDERSQLFENLRASGDLSA
jgi:DNA gyrase/topoisomerase IV subunit A